MPKNAKISDLTVSRTQILDYLSCGYRWDLSYRRGITTARVREALDLGSAVHRGIKNAVHCYAATGFDDLRAATATGCAQWAAEERKTRGQYLTGEMKEQIRALELDAVGIATKALEFIDLPAWEVAVDGHGPVCEVEFIVPLAPWKGFRTIPDFVARRRADGPKAPFWLVDWKCRSSFEEDDAEDINLQFSSMQHVLSIKRPGIKIAGSLLWQIKAQAPRWPSQNKNSEMSRQAIVTDWRTYEAALKKVKLNPADYQDMKEKLEQVRWFHAIKQHRSREEVLREWHQIVVPTAQRMARDPQVIRRFTHMPFACKGCWAREFCLTELRGEDTEFLLETDYMDTRAPRKRRELGDGPKRKFELT